MSRSFMLLVFFLCLTSCENWDVDELDTTGTGEFAIPIGYGSFKVESFFNEASGIDQFLVDEEGRISIVYISNDISVNQSTLIPAFPFGIPIPLTDTAVEVDLPAINGLTITKATLSGEDITFTFSSLVPETLNILLSSTSFTKNGSMFRQDFLMPLSQNLPNIFTTSPILLNDFELNSPEQKIEFKYRAENLAGEYMPLVSAFFTISAISFKSFQGNVSRTAIPLPSGFVDIDFFNSWQEGSISINKPSIHVEIQNSFGLPIGIVLEQVDITSKDGRIFRLSSDLINQTINLNYPSITDKGTLKKTEFTLDNSNSNIEEIFSSLPIRVTYAFSGFVNPDNLDDEFWVSEGSSLSGKASVTIPLDGYADQATVTDTFSVLLSEIPDIREGELSWVANNGMPAGIEIQLELLDKDKNSLGSFFPTNQQVIKPAIVNNEGLVTENSRLVTKIPLSGTILEQLNRTSSIVVLASFTTFERNKRVIFTDDQNLDIYIGLKFKK